MGGFAFAGVGGFELGFARAGITPAWQIENDPFCRRILQQHWPDVRRYGDIREVNAHELEPVDVIVGGFPCQDLSVAGKQRGLQGARSSLFFEFVRIAATVRPEWIVLENVPGLLSSCSCDGCRKCGALLRWHKRRARRDDASRSDDGRTGLCSCRGCAAARRLMAPHRGTDMAVVVSTLANVGYRVAYRILDSRYFGVPQRRRRVFLVCDRGGASARALLSDEGGRDGHPATREASRKIAAGQLARSVSAVGGGNDPGANKGTLVVTEAVTSKWRKGSGGPSGDETQNLVMVTHPLKAIGADASEDGTGRGVPMVLAATMTSSAAESKPGRRLSDDVNMAVTDEGEVRRLTPTECERLQGFPDGWTHSCEVAPYSTNTCKCPDGPRYQVLGNAVTVPVVATIARWIRAA